MGCRARLRIPGRRHQRHHGRLQPQRSGHPVHPDAPRGDGRVHGLRSREVHRIGRGLSGDVGSGSDPPAQWPLRREDGPRARRGPRRPVRANRPRRRLPAGGRSPDALQGRGQGVRADGHDARGRASRHRSRVPDRAGGEDGRVRHRAQGRPGARRRGAAARPRHRAHEHRLPAPRRVPHRGRP